VLMTAQKSSKLVFDKSGDDVNDRSTGVDGAKGLWMQTYTGGRFYGEPQCFHLNEYDIETIAETLSKKVRWGGHCKGFYSVAQHSVHVCDLSPKYLRLEGLLHDMTECFLGDIPRPIKNALVGVRDYEADLYDSMAQQFNCARAVPNEVHVADNMMLRTEARDLMGDPEWHYKMPYPIREEPISIWGMEEAKQEFLKRYDEYKRI
jgi:hypothetical protein